MMGFLRPKNIEGIAQKIAAVYFVERVARRRKRGVPIVEMRSVFLFPIFSDSEWAR